LQNDASLARGLNTYDGAVTYGPVAEAHGRELVPLDEVLA
jgi:alanine dehydrogenase